MGLTQFAPINSGLVSSHSDYAEYDWRSQGIAGKVIWPPPATPWPNVARLRQAIAETQRLRGFVVDPDVDYYPLTAIVRDDSIWAAYQFHRAANNTGFVMVFRRPRASAEKLALHLRGLELASARQFAVKACMTYACGPETTMSGRELAALVVALNQSKSCLYEYRPAASQNA